MAPAQTQTIEDLGRRVKAKYPGAYDDLPDGEVGKRVQAKFPGAYDDFGAAQPAPQQAAPPPAVRASALPPLAHPNDIEVATTAAGRVIGDRLTRPDSMNATIGPAPAPTLFQRLTAPLVGGMSGDVRAQDTPISRAFGGAQEPPAVSKTRDNLVSFENAATDTGPGVARGALEFASGLTSPGNLSVMGVTGGLGALESALGKSTISRLVSLGFSSQMIWDAAQQVPEFMDAVKQKDWPRARQVATKVGLATALAAVGAKHAGSADVRAPEVTDTMRRDAAKPFQEPRAPGPAAPAIPRDVRRASVTPPSSGETEGVARGVDARERLALQLAGRPFAELNAADQNAIDALIAETNRGQGGREKKPPVPVPAPKPKEKPHAETQTGQTGIQGQSDAGAGAVQQGTAGPAANAGPAADAAQGQTAGEVRVLAPTSAEGGSPGEPGEAKAGAGEAPPAQAKGEGSDGSRIEPEGTGGQPAAEVDPRAARAVDAGATGEGSAVHEPPPAGQGRVAGETTDVLIPGEDRSIPARYELRELSDIQSSHHGLTFAANPNYALENERDYSKAENQQRVIEQSSEAQFDPRFHITDNPDMANGPILVDPDGNAVGGNSRTMHLQRVYGRDGQKAAAYRALLEKKAAQFGIDPEAVRGMRQPVLVRVASAEALADLPGGAKWAVRKTNVQGQAALSPSERAAADAGQMPPEMVGYIGDAIEAAGPDATLNDALTGKGGTAIVNRLIAEGFFSEQERPGLMDGKTGALTQAAKDRIGKALLGKFFRDSDQIARTPAAVKNKLERIAAPLAKVQGNAPWDLTPAIQEAVDLLEYARAHDVKNLHDVTAQEGMFGDTPDWNSDAVTLAEWLRDRKPNDLVAAVRRYVNDREPTMFGEATPEESFAQHFGGEKAERGDKPQAGAFGLFGDKAAEAPPTATDLISRMEAEVRNGTLVENYAAREAARGPQEPEKPRFVVEGPWPTGSPFLVRDTFLGTTPKGAKTYDGAQRAADKLNRPPPRKNPERGGISAELLTLGAEKFFKDDVAPAVKEAAATILEAADDILKVLAPQLRSEAAQKGGLILRNRLGELARRYDQAEAALRTARRAFGRMPSAENYDFIARVEAGAKQKTPELDQIAGVLRQLLDGRRQDVQALGSGKLQKFYEHYFPHIWEKPERAAKAFAQFFGRRPLEGGKTFLKKRTLPTFADGLAAGLKPVSDNPIDLTMLKVREMDRYLMAHRVLNDWKEAGLVKFVDARKGKAPAGWMKIADPIGTVYGPSVQEVAGVPHDVGGLVIRGHWHAPEGAARVLNNYLEPGLRAKSGAYRVALGANNELNQAQLGLSAFHLGFTSADAAVSKGALGIEQLLRGKALAALKSVAEVPIAPITNLLKGSKVLREWYKPGSEGQAVAAIVDGLEKAGGRVRMDEFYQTRIAEKMGQAFRNGNLLGGLLRAPFAGVEAVSNVIMKHVVPRQKLGVFADLAAHEMERLGPGATVEQTRAALAKVWDSVENRMGQMTYDNLFWDRTAKDIAMLATRSVGWNLGTIREIGGAPLDAAAIARKGLAGADVHRLAYVTSLAVTSAAMGALYQYLATGQGPQELKDYFFPRNGQVDEGGRPQRVALPTYVKDVYHYATEPGKTLANKVAPVWSLFGEMIHNRDFYGTEIRNADDPLVRQMLDTAAHGAKAFEPFGFRNLERADKLQAPLAQKAQNFVGITPAPAALEKSKAELLAGELARDAIPAGGRTREAAARRDAEQTIGRLARMRKPVSAEIQKDLKAGTLTMADVKRAMAGARLDPLQRTFRGLSLEHALAVWRVATPAERAALRPMLIQKGKSLATKTPVERAALLPKFQEALTANH